MAHLKRKIHLPFTFICWVQNVTLSPIIIRFSWVQVENGELFVKETSLGRTHSRKRYIDSFPVSP